MIKIKRYSAIWCQPCRQLAPIFEQLQQENPDIVFETIDVDQNRELAIENGITSVPTVIFEKNGEQFYRFSGVLSKSVITGIIKQHQ